MHSPTSQALIEPVQADIVISSGHHLVLADHRTTRFPPSGSLALEGGIVKMRSIPISMSTFPQILKRVAAEGAAILTFRNRVQKAASTPAECQDHESLASQSPRKALTKTTVNINQEIAPIQKDLGGIEDHFKMNGEDDNDPARFVRRLTAETKAEWAGTDHEDSVIYHVSPTTENTKLSGSIMETPAQIPHIQAYNYTRSNSEVDEMEEMVKIIEVNIDRTERPRSLKPQSLITAAEDNHHTIQIIWTIVEPVLNPHSALRGGWRPDGFTWEDIILGFVTMSIVATMVVIGLVFAKVAGMILGLLGFLGLALRF
jgi:hypothetical protein